jgi:hypothetical protein
MPEKNQSTAPDPAGPPTGPDGKPADAAGAAPKHSAAVRMMTRSVVSPKPSRGVKAKTQRTADAARPTQKPDGGGTARKVRRGAAKGR